jgi:hypothetical protein
LFIGSLCWNYPKTCSRAHRLWLKIYVGITELLYSVKGTATWLNTPFEEG